MRLSPQETQRNAEYKLAEKMMTRAEKAATAEREETLRIERAAAHRAEMVAVLENADLAAGAAFRKAAGAAKAAVDALAAKYLDSDPLYFLERSESIYQSAARFSIYIKWANYLEDQDAHPTEGRTRVEVLMAEVEKEARRISTDIARSTSRTSNLAEEAKRVILCELAGFSGWASENPKVLPFYCSFHEFAAKVALYRAGRVDEAVAS